MKTHAALFHFHPPLLIFNPLYIYTPLPTPLSSVYLTRNLFCFFIDSQFAFCLHRNIFTEKQLTFPEFQSDDVNQKSKYFENYFCPIEQETTYAVKIREGYSDQNFCLPNGDFSIF